MIREAKPEDGAQVMPIVDQIFEEMEIPELQRVPKPQLFGLLTQLFQTDNYRYSYRRTLVAVDQADRIQGIAVSYPEEDEAEIDVPLKPYLDLFGLTPQQELFPDKEACAGEWYLDSLAVAPTAQNRGIGGDLIETLKTKVPAGYRYLSLNVDLQNPAAQRLYERHGFETQGNLMIGSHHYRHMRYPLG